MFAGLFWCVKVSCDVERSLVMNTGLSWHVRCWVWGIALLPRRRVCMHHGCGPLLQVSFDVCRSLLMCYTFRMGCWVSSATTGLYTWLIQIFLKDMTHTDLFAKSCLEYVSWLIRMWHDSFWNTGLIPISCAGLVWCMWHDSFICNRTHSYVTWLILKYMTDTDLLCRSCLMYVTWLIHM